MSREVEVSNIQMSATVPEDIQISLGAIAKGDGSAISDKEGTASLTNGLGVLWKGANGASADDGAVQAPTNDWDWSNIADISEYYQFGKLIPASSTTGEDIFFTPQATGNGQTLAANAEFYMAADLLAGKQEKDLGNASITRTTPLAATLHAVTKKSSGYVDDKWSTAGNGDTNGAKNYSGSTAWDNTNDDGYYVDIPVWLRTSSSSGAKLSVQGYVKPKSVDTKAGATSDNALYRAVRVAIIDVGDGTAVNNPEAGVAPYSFSNESAVTKNLIPLADAWTLATDSAEGKLTSESNPFAFNATDASKNTIDNSILNWYGRTVATGASNATALNVTQGKESGAFAAVKSISGKAATYGNVTVYDPVEGSQVTDANIVCSLTGPNYASGKKAHYGTPHKIIVRVWLEGEDPDCWNETAGQDWSINLKFNNELTSPLTTYGGDDLTNVNESTAPKIPASTPAQP